MMKLVVGTFLTLDGVMQAPGGPGEDPEGGFEHGGWSFGYWDEVMGGVMDGWIRHLDALLLGRKTYQIFAGHWPKVTDPNDPVATRFNAVPKYVASTTLDNPEWIGTTVIKGDVANAVRRLKDQPGDEIQVHGSGNLIQTLLANDLVDQFRLWSFPVVLGTGKRLFAEGAIPSGMELVDSVMSTTGVAINTYRRSGEIKFGSFALDQ
jgi:dihydrofolate reductase